MTEEQLEQCRSQLVVKSNDLIQKTRYHLSIQQQRIILFIISKLKPDDEDFKTYEFSLYDLCDICGIEHHGQNYKNFKDSIQQLHNSAFWFETETTEDFIYWVTDVHIDKITKVVTLRLDPRLRPYLLNLRERFTCYEYGTILQMESKYSYRIYELLKSYSNLGVVQFNLKNFKEALEITTEYSDYRNFKRIVIDKSLDEINKYTDLDVSFLPIKTGRKVTALSFQMILKNDIEIAKLRLNREHDLNSKGKKKV